MVEEVIPAEWELSTIVNCYKGKRDSFERGNQKDLKLIDQVQKIAEGITQELIRQQLGIDEMQFGFMPGCVATNFIVLRQLQEKYLRSKNENLYSAFVDLEKVFDRMPGEVAWWAFRKLEVVGYDYTVDVQECSCQKSFVRVNGGFSDDFLVQVGLHQGSG